MKPATNFVSDDWTIIRNVLKTLFSGRPLPNNGLRLMKHSKVLNLSLQIRQGGEEKQSKLQKFLETGVKFGVTGGEARGTAKGCQC